MLTNSLPRTAAMILLAAAIVSPSTVLAQAKVEYNRDVRPILAEYCFNCHGPDSASRKAGLRLDQRDAAIKAEAFVPGDAAKSELITRVFSTDVADMMPPPKAHKKLTAAHKETLKQWIAAGAEYQPHWSFVAAKRPTMPTVKNEAWVRNPIDRFILAELEKKGMQPGAEADRRAIARRLSLDLNGLPPLPADVEKFVNDKAPDAYEKFVDHLLASTSWGEHRGRYWLDAARYADTHGIHFDNFREMHAYRDWVINAFNKNQPFDQFTIEQIAGDLLPNRTMDQQVATGFNRCNITTNEGGAISEEYLVLYARDRTETVAQTWLGLTAGCCTCHDHKFDPVSQKDFYSLSAFFNNTTQNAMDGNIRDTPPVIFVPKLADRPRYDAISKEIAAVKARVDARKKDALKEHDAWLKTVKIDEAAKLVPIDGLKLHAPLVEGKGSAVGYRVDGKDRAAKLESGFAWVDGKTLPKAFAIKPGASLEIADVGDYDKGQAFSYSAWVRIPRRGVTGAVFARMDNTKEHRGWDLWLDQDRPTVHIIHKWPEDAVRLNMKTALQPGQWYHVQATYDGSGKGAGVKLYLNGVVQPTDITHDTLKGTTRTEVPFKVGQRHTSERLVDVALHDLRIYNRALAPQEVAQLAKSNRSQELLAKPADKRTPKEREELFDWWLVSLDTAYRDLNAEVSKLQAEEATLKSRGTIAHVANEKPGEPIAHVLYRGDYDKRREQVKAATPSALPAMPADLPRNRLGFAQWLLRPENPLTARVTVNRFWQEVFGNGIVRTSGDFGISGDLPSHPELLDWLALEFRDKNWDIKQFFKLIVTSATYRQSSATTPEKHERDPSNRWLSRGPRYRMDAEMIRDHALASSGLLVRKIGGPSVKPYMPEGVWEAVGMIGSNTRDYRRDTGEALYRRSMYTFWKRAAPPASMDIFNAPNRETCAVRRERTNTPLQALVTLNDVQFVEAARHLAQAALKEGGADDASRIDFMARRLIARPFRAEETKIVQDTLADLVAHYKGKADEARKLISVGESRPDASLDVPTLAAWTMLANELMNLDEVLNK